MSGSPPGGTDHEGKVTQDTEVFLYNAATGTAVVAAAPVTR